LNETSYDFLTNNKDNKKDKTYIIISEVLTRMLKAGLFELGAGYCISMSDMVRTALKQRGIDSKIVECTLAMTYHDSTPPEISFVGFDNIRNPGEIDTHVIVITDTTPSYLIDASIPHRLPRGTLAVIEPIEKTNNFKLLDCKFDSVNISMTYEQKKIQNVPYKHQESIIERIQTDHKIFKNLLFLKILIVLALFISCLNFIRGSYDFYQVYVNNENIRGPSGIEMLHNKINDLEKLIKQYSK
jgi:hypothetical protein